MKNIITSIIAVAGLTLFAIPAMAATTATLSPAAVSVAVGQTFTVSIAINPNGNANYAEKVEIKYPADMLEVRGFTFAPSWTALNQSGYDITDNTNGVLVKTAGYSSGFTTATNFGTVTFYAKTAGTAPILLGSNSLAFDAGSPTAISGTPVIVTIGSYIAPVVRADASEKVVLVASTSLTSTDTTATTSNITAAAGDATDTGYRTLYISLAILAVLVIGGVAYFVTKKA